MSKFTAIYVRRSVSDKDKGNNSLSIDAQREECIRYVGEEADYKVYCDDGKSGKDVYHRPEFMQMMSDAKDGLIDKIVVKKYDRFSRNMREYLNITDELDRYGVGVISLSEPFNTETKEGRMMRNNLLNFAEFERETIAARVKDAYSTKAVETGFYQGGKVYFGYETTRQTVNGKTGSVLVPCETAETVAAIFEQYKNPETSLSDVVTFIQDNNLPVNGVECGKDIKRSLDKSTISLLLKNPLYVRADKDVYRYLLSKGCRIIDDIDAFDGVHGLFWHNYRSKTEMYVKVGYHEGIVDSETWLAVQDKKSHHSTPLRKGVNLKSWLSGLMKCGHCGRGIHIDYSVYPKTGREWRYLNCSGYGSVKGCVTNRIYTKIEDIEEAVHKAMQEHITEFEILRSKEKPLSAEEERIKSELVRIETETAKLMDKLADADEVLFAYIQERVNALHTKKNEYEQQLMKTERRVKNIDTKPIKKPLSRWDELSITEKNALAKVMIDKIMITDETGIDIHFNF